MFFTTSWDDGHPLDLKLADLLNKYGLQGTFYIPASNREGLPVVDTAGVRALAGSFEVGSHTFTHAYANRMSLSDWTQDVRQGKAALEQVLGLSVAGFCYPGGKLVAGAKEAVARAGFAYARTCVNFCTQAGSDPLLMHTSMQYYPHRPAVILRNWLSNGHWAERSSAALLCLNSPDLNSRVLRLLEQHKQSNAVVHLWGHSWEIESQGLWGSLEALFRTVQSLVPANRRLTNHGVLKQTALL
jgi:peptidoglycan-N-acetylglucosamine deacetylase